MKQCKNPPCTSTTITTAITYTTAITTGDQFCSKPQILPAVFWQEIVDVIAQKSGTAGFSVIRETQQALALLIFVLRVKSCNHLE